MKIHVGLKEFAILKTVLVTVKMKIIVNRVVNAGLKRNSLFANVRIGVVAIDVRIVRKTTAVKIVNLVIVCMLVVI